ncbi:hypothetical protein F3J20_28780 [Paraburkholderia sp. Cy-641]|uniref:hypothetical protein n=1 Tax=Paraburkholderia sp. Cy-641 TaxID=2608337 RepID=UPI0014248556|nr:hypothetical protein [Paraburkholderia sp. Cy-641]NIF81325.1 hypothetical protein [Paraburkholderia sp. Cy-641]
MASDTFTADDFVDRYMNLQAGSSEWPTSVSLNKYMIGADYSSPKAQARAAVRTAALKKHLGPKDSAFARANCGKVSPDDCEHILTLAVDSGTVQPENIQVWADRNLGVDCTGFVVAFYDALGIMDIERYSGGASCFTFINKAKHNHRPPGESPLIWELDDVQPSDMILWMNDAQVETRSPGHIALIYDVDCQQGILYTAESNGADDGEGHYGPKISERIWNGRNKDRGPHYLQLGKSDKVIIVRPPPMFG